MKIISMTLALLLAASAAHAEDVPKDIRDRGVLRLAVSASYAPMEFVDATTGELAGVDIDLGNALGEKLGLKVEWTNTPFAQLITALNSGRIDFILSGMKDTAARRETMDFVNYMSSGEQFLVSEGSDMTKMLDLCGRQVGASRSTTYGETVEAWSAANCDPAGRPPLTFAPAASAIDARSQMQQGRIDAVIQGNETLPHTLKVEPGLYRIFGEPITFGLQGIAFRKPDTQLRDAVFEALTEIMEDGTYAEILSKYGLSSNALDKPTINAGPK